MGCQGISAHKPLVSRHYVRACAPWVAIWVALGASGRIRTPCRRGRIWAKELIMETGLMMLMFLAVTIVIVAYALEKIGRLRKRQGVDRGDDTSEIRNRRNLRRRRASRLFGKSSES